MIEYQVIGENVDGTLTVRISDGVNLYDRVIAAPSPPSVDDLIQEAVAREVALGLTAPVVADDITLEGGAEVPIDIITAAEEPTP